ncbi:hypothetical protein BD410DRAFT_783579 [Rickenella mellea]|uniref:BTB domain-containing protein n=1 Tax=Rickenella mellea TaxID=50990 RepID=A0A4Y7QH03_9AGAM|nr:hypothetical protein BD410DRAFT_783579 [Rickenella mellea]
MAEPQTDVEPDTAGNSSASHSNAPQYHPSFSSPDADIVILSDDGVLFRVHKLVLQLGSGFFKTMLEMPRDAAEALNNEPILIQEKSNVFAILLDIIYPDRQPHDPQSLEFVQEILQAAEKFDMPKVSKTIRRLATPQSTFLTSAIDLYVLASQNGWEDVAKIASAETLKTNLYSSEYRDSLKRLDGNYLIRLVNLHRRRRRLFIDALDPNLDSEPKVVWRNVISSAESSPCHHFSRGFTLPWTNLKHFVSEALDVQPVGDAIRERSFIDNPALKTLWDYQCHLRDCVPRFHFLKEKLHPELIRILDLLPSTI